MNEKVSPPIPPPVIKPPAPPQIPSRGLGRISGAEGLTPQELREAAGRGGRFIVFPYCISALVVSFRRSSPIFFIKPGESVFAKGAPYCLISLFAGWWGIPWGPIWTLISLATNLSGGKDVTPGVLSALGITAPVTTTPPEVSPMVAAEREDRKTFIMRLAWAVVALIVLGVACVGYKIYEANRKALARPGQAEFRAANARIGTLGTNDSGNTAKAAELAGQMSKGMSLLRDLGFEQAKEKSFIDDRDQFKTYCDLQDDHCVFLIHVPELRRFDADAQKALGHMAWLSAQQLIEKTETGKPGMRLAVGLRGIAAYNRVLTGQYTPGATETRTGITNVYDALGCERQLFSWFAPKPQ